MDLGNVGSSPSADPPSGTAAACGIVRPQSSTFRPRYGKVGHKIRSVGGEVEVEVGESEGGHVLIDLVISQGLF